MIARSPVDRNRLVRGMRRIALSGLAAGALIVGAFLLALLQDRSLPGPSLVFVILGAGILAVSIRIFLPSYPQSIQRRFARLEAMTEEQRQVSLGRMIRKQLVVVGVALLVEIPVAAALWSLVEWRSLIAGAVGTTVLSFVLLGAILLRRRMSPSK